MALENKPVRLSLKCFLCSQQFEGSRFSRSRSGPGSALLSIPDTSFMLNEVLRVESDETEEQSILTTEFQKTWYCNICLENISKVKRLVDEKDLLDQKISAMKTELVETLRESCDNGAGKTNSSSGIMQMQRLRMGIVEEMNKTMARKELANKKSVPDEAAKCRRKEIDTYRWMCAYRSNGYSCGFTTLFPSTLRIHQKYVHTELYVGPYICRVCRRIFRSIILFRSHRRIRNHSQKNY